MTKEQFYYRFNVYADKVASQDAPGYTEEEVAEFATYAQNELILTYYDSKEKALVGAFEGSEKTKVYLDELNNKSIITPVIDNVLHEGLEGLNSYLVVLPEECMFITSEWSKDNDNNTINFKPVEYDYLEANFKNPYKKPENWIGNRLMWRLNFSRNLEGLQQIYLIGYDLTPITYHVNYIKHPSDIDLENNTNEQVSELDKAVHFELLLMTIQKAGIATDTELQQLRIMESETTK